MEVKRTVEKVGSPEGAGEAPGAGPLERATASPARLRIAVSRLARWLRPTAAAGTLTAAEIDLLMVAERHGPVRMSDFAAFCGLNPTMLSRMAPRLEKAGLLQRSTEPGDRRAVLVRATPGASELLDRVRSERDDVLSKLLDELDEGQREVVMAATPVLEILAERLREQVREEGQGR